MRLDEIVKVFGGSDGGATKAMYDQLEAVGHAGHVAVNLFRAMKTSARAKVYRGSRYRGASYDRKNWSINNLCRALVAHDLGLRWGWGYDDKVTGFEHVLYVDLPSGQVSFHAGARSDGPDYPGSWDGARGTGPDRVCRFVADVFKNHIANGKKGKSDASNVDGSQPAGGGRPEADVL